MTTDWSKFEDYEKNVLPADPSPIHYDLSLVPNMTSNTFTGTVTIDMAADKPCSAVTLNALELSLKEAKVLAQDGKVLETITEFKTDERNQTASFSLAKPLQGSFSVTISYTGTINNRMAGFYRSGPMAVTQFESCDARRAFPCWDEPARKATFQMAMVVPKNLQALGNMPVVDTKPASKEQAEAAGAAADVGADLVQFGKTVKMSTYLVAWALGEFDYVEQKVKKTHHGGGGVEDETLVRCYCLKGKKVEQLRFALEVACKVLPMQERFFGRNFQLPKVDLLAVENFAAGAMENWGLITYRESILFCDLETSAAKAKEWTALVVAHELTHSWFGNEVTMAWWSGLWLNESNTTWVEFLLTHEMFKDWQCMTGMCYDDYERAFQLNALESSHPVEVPIKIAQEVDEVFDVISYNFGMMCMRMMTLYLGDQWKGPQGEWDSKAMAALSHGMTHYIEKFSYKNATTQDLLKALSEANGVPELVDLMCPWIYQQGFPVVTVKSVADGKAKMTQRRFLAGKMDDSKPDPTLWPIPVKVQLPGGKSTTVVKKERDFEVDVGAGTKWFSVNGDRTAPMRVLYSPELLETLKEPIATKQLGAIDRFAILADLHSFCVHGLASIDTALSFAAAYANDDDATVWATVAALDADVRAKLLPGQSQEVKDKYNEFARGLFSDILARVGMQPDKAKDSHRSSQLRAAVFGRAAAAKVPAAVSAALKYFDDAIAAGALKDTTKNPIPADLRGPVYTTALGQRKGEALTALKEMHAAAQGHDATEAQRIVRCVGFGDSEELCQAALDWAMSDKVGAQDSFIAIVVVAGNEFGQKPFEKLLLGQWALLNERFPGMIMSRITKAVENSFDLTLGEKLLKHIESLPEEEKNAVLRTANQGAEGQKVLAAWRARDCDKLKAFVSK